MAENTSNNNSALDSSSSLQNKPFAGVKETSDFFEAYQFLTQIQRDMRSGTILSGLDAQDWDKQMTATHVRDTIKHVQEQAPGHEEGMIEAYMKARLAKHGGRVSQDISERRFWSLVEAEKRTLFEEAQDWSEGLKDRRDSRR